MARRGRPTKTAKPGTKVSLGLKVTAMVKGLLEAEAAKSGRTQSQEAEYRLERSFFEDYLLAHSVTMNRVLRSEIFEALEVVMQFGNASDRKLALDKIRRSYERADSQSGLMDLEQLEKLQSRSLKEHSGDARILTATRRAQVVK